MHMVFHFRVEVPSYTFYIEDPFDVICCVKWGTSKYVSSPESGNRCEFSSEGNVK